MADEHIVGEPITNLISPDPMDDHFETENYERTYYMVLGSSIKKAREVTGKTQSDIAKALGLSASAIANYEAGTRQIPVHTLIQLAQILGKPLQYFLGPFLDFQLFPTQALKDAIGKLTDASYIKKFYEISGSYLFDIERPEPWIPLPSEIAKDHDFAIREFNQITDTYNYYLCKYYRLHPDDVDEVELDGFEPDDLILVAKEDDKGILLEWTIVQIEEYRSDEWELLKKAYTISVQALVIAKIERLAK
jgi:transcriptional regulator with XRE-family HTH domain